MQQPMQQQYVHYPTAAGQGPVVGMPAYPAQGGPAAGDSFAAAGGFSVPALAPPAQQFAPGVAPEMGASQTYAAPGVMSTPAAPMAAPMAAAPAPMPAMVPGAVPMAAPYALADPQQQAVYDESAAKRQRTEEHLQGQGQGQGLDTAGMAGMAHDLPLDQAQVLAAQQPTPMAPPMDINEVAV
mmetsp:Transcript_23293/g.52536  ORF Transcript_23293/g.52536 Transcript_23293/m.52536 type:complete len:183 (-) Transcript_23293:204-752(-)